MHTTRIAHEWNMQMQEEYANKKKKTMNAGHNGHGYCAWGAGLLLKFEQMRKHEEKTKEDDDDDASPV